MAKLDDLIEDLVTANHVLARLGIVDLFGHISIRHPDKPDRFFLSCSRAPERVKRDDIVEFNLECEPIDAKGKQLYTERPIHGGAYQARPDVMSVIHNHSPGVIPYGITGHKMRPVMHMCASIGNEVPIWDQHSKFGDTDLLVRTMEQGRDLAKKLGKNGTCLMRGHGCVVVGPYMRRTVYTAVYLELNAKLQMPGRGHEQEGQVPHQGRGQRGGEDHVAGQRQPRLGELVPDGRPAVPGRRLPRGH